MDNQTELPGRQSQTKSLKLKPGVPTARFVPQPEVAVPEGGNPNKLIDKSVPDSEKVQVYWHVHVRVFRLPEDTEAYQEVWQKISDGMAQLSKEEMSWDPKKAGYVALLRWVEFDYTLPVEP